MGLASSCFTKNNPSHNRNAREQNGGAESIDPANVILNSDFSNGKLEPWRPVPKTGPWLPLPGEGIVVSSSAPEGISAATGGSFARIINRRELYQGLEQDITKRISPHLIYAVFARVAVSGTIQGNTKVQATLRLEYHDRETKYLYIGSALVSNLHWEKLEGVTFSLSSIPDCVVFYLEGPPPGVDLLIDSVVISQVPRCVLARDENIIQNPEFRDDLSNWTARHGKIRHELEDGTFFASTTQRIASFSGIQQDISARVQQKVAYEITAHVRISNNDVEGADVKATLFIRKTNLQEQYIHIAKVQATNKNWVELKGKFLLNDFFSTVVIYIEGPPEDTDIHVKNLIVKRPEKIPKFDPRGPPQVAYGVNIIENSDLDHDTFGWFPHGKCNIVKGTGSPCLLPPMARDSLGTQRSLSGYYIHVINRTSPSMGPAQSIIGKVELYVTYQVAAWVRIGAGSTGTQNVKVSFDVDDNCIDGGQVEANATKWYEIGGSFRLEKQPSKVVIYVHGPSPGIDLMVAGLQVFPIDRQARFKQLKYQTEKLRKRDVILKFSGAEAKNLRGTQVKIKQEKNTFPFGSSITKSGIHNEYFKKFFVRNFNWAVFEKELTWAHTEPQKNEVCYKDSDDLLSFCKDNGIKVRGHCIFSGVEDHIQSWVLSLNKDDLDKAVQNRLGHVLSRHRGQFRHYDVNDEVLHESFYRNRLGKDFAVKMFKKAHELDNGATLFVTDYHVDNGFDRNYTPEKYIEHIIDLQKQGAPIGGIGVKGHMNCPVGILVCSALDKLSTLGLPIWFTELDVSSTNEYLRADDLEVMLRECFAHPAVDGIVLWGFWELLMSRGNAHLVDAEGEINEAGQRYLDLREEWLTNIDGVIDDNGDIKYRGFHGKYDVEVVSKGMHRTFEVGLGEFPLSVTIAL